MESHRKAKNLSFQRRRFKVFSGLVREKRKSDRFSAAAIDKTKLYDFYLYILNCKIRLKNSFFTVFIF